MNSKITNDKVKTDWIMFGATIATILLVCIPIVGFQEQSGQFITAAYDTKPEYSTFSWLSLLAVGVLMCASLVKMLREDFNAS